jgi:hypothetical protein
MYRDLPLFRNNSETMNRLDKVYSIDDIDRHFDWSALDGGSVNCDASAYTGQQQRTVDTF